jgi:hypothetical protein
MNHEQHETRQHDRPYRLRLPSPLPPADEQMVTQVIGCAIDVHKALDQVFSRAFTRERCLSSWRPAGFFSSANGLSP